MLKAVSPATINWEKKTFCKVDERPWQTNLFFEYHITRGWPGFKSVERQVLDLDFTCRSRATKMLRVLVYYKRKTNIFSWFEFVVKLHGLIAEISGRKISIPLIIIIIICRFYNTICEFFIVSTVLKGNITSSRPVDTPLSFPLSLAFYPHVYIPSYFEKRNLLG